MTASERPAAAPAEGAQDMNTVIADNLRALRQGLNLSLSEVSERTGVSKSMLGQIERNESSPTISTLWKIATGLQVSFTSLMERPEQGIRIVRESEVTPVINDHGRFRLYPVVPAQADRSFELVDLELIEGAVSESMVGSIAYSLVDLRANDAEGAQALADSVKENVNPAKWICVQAEAVNTAVIGDVVFMVMADQATADALTASFEALAQA